MNDELKLCCAGMCSKPVKKYDKYCSMHRARLTRHGRLDKPNYLEIVFKNSKPMPNGCIEWQGYKNKDGYGRRRFRGFKKLVHREVYALTRNSTIPFGLIVCHTCDNPPCINPAHLFLGTHKDNNADMRQKGRCNPAKGERHGMAKLTTEQARKIKSSPLLVDILAKDYEVTKETIRNIKGSRTWKNL